MGSTRRTDPALWEAVKARVTAGSKGGRPGQWSARKAQFAVQLYKAAGGGYVGPKDPDNSLTRWTKQDWRTRSGLPSLQTGERYLPAAAIRALSPAEYAATTRAKRKGMEEGKQFVPQPPAIAQKVAPHRRNGEEEASPKGPYLYHATHLGKLGSIVDVGLTPSAGSQFSEGYDAHSRGRIFLTDFDGLPYWFHKMELIAEHNSDFEEESDVIEWTPIVLRISAGDALTYYTDAPGNRDNLSGESYYVKESVHPEDIEVWDGSNWTSLDYVNIDALEEQALAAVEQEEDEDYLMPDFNVLEPQGP